MNRWVEINFDCLPLRSVTRLDIPLDASPGYRALCERIKAAIEMHGNHNTYYLYNASCTYHLTNHPDVGMLQFKFEGTLFTDATDLKPNRCDLTVELTRETCDWINASVVQWFHESVQHSVCVANRVLTDVRSPFAAGSVTRTPSARLYGAGVVPGVLIQSSHARLCEEKDHRIEKCF